MTVGLNVQKQLTVSVAKLKNFLRVYRLKTCKEMARATFKYKKFRKTLNLKKIKGEEDTIQEDGRSYGNRKHWFFFFVNSRKLDFINVITKIAG